MSQLNAGEVFTDVSPGKTVTSTRLNNHVNGGTLLNGAVLDQTEKVTPIAADTVLLGDSTLSASAAPKKVQLANLLLQSQRDGTQRWGGVAGGTANALTVTTSPASTGAYVSGEIIRFKTGASANSGAVTINLDARGVVNLYRFDQAALISGDLPANSLVEAVYDGTQFLMVRVVIASKTLTSYMAAESLRAAVHQYISGAGSANAYTAAPLDSSGAALLTSLVTGQAVTFKASFTNTGAATLAVNGLTAKTIKRIVAGAVADLVANDIQTGDLVTAVYDGTNYLLTARVRSWDYVGTAAATLAAGVTAFPHGLGFVPTKVRVVFLCTTNQSPWVANASELDSGNIQLAGGSVRMSWWADATNVNVSLYANNVLSACDTSSSLQTLTAGSWKLKVYASL